MLSQNWPLQSKAQIGSDKTQKFSFNTVMKELIRVRKCSLSMEKHENIQKASIHISLITDDIGGKTFKLLGNFVDFKMLIFTAKARLFVRSLRNGYDFAFAFQFENIWMHNLF